jgi:hypothetical protein
MLAGQCAGAVEKYFTETPKPSNLMGRRAEPSLETARMRE